MTQKTRGKMLALPSSCDDEPHRHLSRTDFEAETATLSIHTSEGPGAPAASFPCTTNSRVTCSGFAQARRSPTVPGSQGKAQRYGDGRSMSCSNATRADGAHAGKRCAHAPFRIAIDTSHKETCKDGSESRSKEDTKRSVGSIPRRNNTCSSVPWVRIKQEPRGR